MVFGGERSITETNLLRKALQRVRGDFHVGRWIRLFHLRRALDAYSIRPRRILDAGCGTGEYSFFLARRFAAARVLGVDLLKSKIEICCAIESGLKINNTAFRCQDLQEFRSLEQYDLIILSGVLCGIPDYEKVIAALAGSLTAGGWMIIQDMNRQYIERVYGPAHEVGEALRPGFHVEELLESLSRHGVATRAAQKTLGALGDAAHRLFGRVRTHSVLLHLLFPVMLAMGYADTLVDSRDGSGLLIVGQKEPHAA